MLLVKIGLQVWRRQPLLQSMFSFALGALALGGASLFALDLGMKPLVKGHLAERTVSLYLESGSDASLVAIVMDRVKTSVGSSPRVRLMDRHETVEKLEKSHPVLAKELSALAPREIQALVPESVIVEGKISAAELEQLSKIEGVERVEWVAGKFRQTASALQAFRWILRSMMAAFALAAAVMSLQIARTQQSSLQSTLKVIRASGARAWQTAVPGAAAGLVSGALAGSVASLGWLLGLHPAFESVRTLSPALALLNAPGAAGAALLFLSCALGAAFCGAAMSLTSERAGA